MEAVWLRFRNDLPEAGFARHKAPSRFNLWLTGVTLLELWRVSILTSVVWFAIAVAVAARTTGSGTADSRSSLLAMLVFLLPTLALPMPVRFYYPMHAVKLAAFLFVFDIPKACDAGSKFHYSWYWELVNWVSWVTTRTKCVTGEPEPSLPDPGLRCQHLWNWCSLLMLLSAVLHAWMGEHAERVSFLRTRAPEETSGEDRAFWTPWNAMLPKFVLMHLYFPNALWLLLLQFYKSQESAALGQGCVPG
eukprot:evm.model.scf_757EXC.7 EVM.evm.TU.scf_757EXC.7   scf_757EXC:52508-53391(+)